MGFRGLNIGSLLIIFFIIVLLFGTKRLREVGGDLGAAIRSFRKGMQDGDTLEQPVEEVKE